MFFSSSCTFNITKLIEFKDWVKEILCLFLNSQWYRKPILCAILLNFLEHIIFNFFLFLKNKNLKKPNFF